MSIRHRPPLHAKLLWCGLLAGSCSAGIGSFSGTAHAFKFASAISEGCHEAISVEAVERAGWPGELRPPPLSQEERLIARDLAFDVTGAKTDSWILALSVGVRFNDLHELAATDLPGLSTLHDDPDLQKEHCLRSRADDGVAGDRSALRACEKFMFEHVDAALGERARTDMDERTTVDVALTYQGKTRVSLNRYGFEVGRALHALQDSFSHTFRSPDGMRVRHVLNFVESARDDDYLVARDGYPHSDALDLCNGSEARSHRRKLAVLASQELLGALNDVSVDRDERRAAAHAVIARWLDYEAGCTIDNDWCDAPERNELEPGCSVSGAAPALRGGASLSAASSGVALWPVAFAILILLRGRRRRSSGATLVLCALLLASSGSAPAAAQEVKPAFEEHATLANPFGVAAAAAGSIDEGAFAARLSGHFRVAPRFELGLNIELNPWFSLETQSVEPGSLNVFGTLVFEWLEAGSVALRTSGHLGMSVLLFDLVGAPEGSVGPLLGISLLGLSVGLTREWKVLIEPAEVMVPIVQLEPIPFYYRQYRFALGVQFNP